MPRLLRFSQTVLVLCLILQAVACGGSSDSNAPDLPASEAQGYGPPAGEPGLEAGFPAGPPRDWQRPWEERGPAGQILPQRSTLSLDDSSVFLTGVQTDSIFGSVSPAGAASTLSSGSAGGGQASFAVYRLTMGGAEPGVVAVDLNLEAQAGGGGLSSYWVGLSCYSDGAWEWHGPYTDGQLRLSTGAAAAAGASYLSPLGNLFVVLAGYDGAAMEIVGVGANPRDPADSLAPAAPGGLTAMPVAGGLELQWNALLAADLAGYRIYYSSGTFSSAADAGVEVLPYLEGTTRLVLHGISGPQHVRIAAVDISGNESALSAEASATPLGGSAPGLLVTTDITSGRVGSSATLSVSGGDSYDVDLDGDGTFDTIGSTATSFALDTSATGILRPRVRASSGSAAVALGGVSLIIAANFPPVARLTLTPTQCTVWGGETVVVGFDASASTDDGGFPALQFAYDPQGDGTFSAFSGAETTNKNYSLPGTYLAAVIVQDAEGLQGFAYAVETVRQAAGFESKFPDRRQNSGANSSAAMINGHPAIAYQTKATSGLSYVRALDPHGEAWSEPLDLDLTVNMAVYCALAEIAGRPAVAYHDNIAGTIRYMRASTSTGQSISDWPGSAYDIEDVVGIFNDLDLEDINGRPALVVVIGNTLFYERASSSGDSAGHWSGAAIQVGPDNVNDVVLHEVNGRPAVAYTGNSQLRYERSSTINGDSGAAWAGNSVLVSGADGVATGQAAFAVIGGRPAVAYQEVGGSWFYIKYSRAATADGTVIGDWPAPQRITNIEADYYALSLADVDGKPGLGLIVDFATKFQTAFSIGLDADGTQWTSIERANSLDIDHSSTPPTSIVSGPGWCGIASQLSNPVSLEFATLHYN